MVGRKKIANNIKWIGTAVLVLAAWTLVPLPEAAGTENVFASRRDRMRGFMAGGALLHSGLPALAFDKNFYFLTGVREPDALLLVAPEGGFDVLFLRDMPDAGRLRAIAEASVVLQVSPLADFDWTFGRQMSWSRDLYIPRTYDASYYLILDLVKGYPHLRLRNLSLLLAKMREVKTAAEIALVRRASETTAAGLSAAMRAAVPGMVESDLQKIIEDVFRAQGAERTSFPSIIGSGPNSVIIHYSQNTRTIEPGDVVVMDVGAEYAAYAGDITRTIPISGVFSARQKEIYEIVLEAQTRAIAACRAGASRAAVDAAARDYIKNKGYGSYFTHSTSHALGLDVHDPWPSARLRPGVIITVEPGIYLPAENLGVRIEDDVLITESGPVVLSGGVPKTVEAIERLMRSRGLANH